MRLTLGQHHLDAIERRDTNRRSGTGEILLFWHHDPSRIAAYEAIDTSGTGARLRTDAPIPEGMTGVAVGFRPGDGARPASEHMGDRAARGGSYHQTAWSCRCSTWVFGAVEERAIDLGVRAARRLPPR
jgi:hypothetical protein